MYKKRVVLIILIYNIQIIQILIKLNQFLLLKPILNIHLDWVYACCSLGNGPLFLAAGFGGFITANNSEEGKITKEVEAHGGGLLYLIINFCLFSLLFNSSFNRVCFLSFRIVGQRR